jgi:hypothetical protein
MRMARTLLLVLTAALVAPAAVGAQEMPPVPKPGPEHELFKTDAGTWDAVVEMMGGPGASPMKSTGVETSLLGCGGLCLITDFKGEMMPGQTFEGHGVAAYDAVKKKYVGSWTDSMSAGLSISESSYDAAAKKSTGWMEGPDMTGKVTKMRSIVEYPDTSRRVFTMYSTGPDGKEVPGLRITYTRRK